MRGREIRIVRALSVVLAGTLLGLPSVPCAVAVGEVDPWVAIALTSIGMVGGMTLVAMASARLVAYLERRAKAKGTQPKLLLLVARAEPVIAKFGLPGLGIIRNIGNRYVVIGDNRDGPWAAQSSTSSLAFFRRASVGDIPDIWLTLGIFGVPRRLNDFPKGAGGKRVVIRAPGLGCNENFR